MKTVGIIADYNPFHNGHCLQIREIRRQFPDAGIVVAMSGSFTQRGMVAILDKWRRAEAAVRHGASLVLELPTVFSTRSAQFFAEGGTRLLDRIDIVDGLAFGSECADVETLTRLAETIDKNQQSAALKNGLKNGRSYAASVTESAGPDADIRQPNVILAVEYMRAIQRFHANLSPIPLPRFSAKHHDPGIPADGVFPVASASAIRAAITEGKESDALRAVPADVKAMLTDSRTHGRPDMENLFRPLLVKLLPVSSAALQTILGINEGIEHRVRRAAFSAHSHAELVEAIRSKRYSLVHVQRLLLHVLLDFPKEAAIRFEQAGPLYARVLAFDDQGRRLLRAARKRAKIPIVTKLSLFLPARALDSERLSPAQEMLAFDLRATALASLASNPVGFPAANSDFLVSPVYLQKQKDAAHVS